MYSVLIVDDEKIIREGIANEMPWEELGLSLAGVASNGQEGLLRLKEEQIDIAIADIKMPVLSGLEMVEAARAEGIQTEFIVISGYEDFEYAHTAMKNGVKYFLLKPTSPEDIVNALKGVCEKLDKKREAARLEYKYEESNRKLKALMKEQFLRDKLLGKVYTKEEQDYFLNFLGIKNKELSAVALWVNAEKDPGRIFLARSIAEDYFGEKLALCTIIHDLVYFIIDCAAQKELLKKVEGLVKELKKIGFTHVTATFKEKWDILSPASSCDDLEECIRFRFYVPDAEIITPEDAELAESDTPVFVFGTQTLLNCLRCGDFDSAKTEIESFFELLLNQKSNTETAKFHSLRLYTELLNIYRGSAENYLNGSNAIMQMKTLNEVKEYIISFAEEMARENRAKIEKKSNRKIDKMLSCIEENLANEEFSLKWLANNLLYFNNDYLGKLFKKEVGVSFTSYVIKRRIEKACELFRENPEAHIYDVAEKTGFGDNTQYFSQVFKKEMGVVPSEWQKSL